MLGSGCNPREALEAMNRLQVEFRTRKHKLDTTGRQRGPPRLGGRVGEKKAVAYWISVLKGGLDGIVRSPKSRSVRIDSALSVEIRSLKLENRGVLWIE